MDTLRLHSGEELLAISLNEYASSLLTEVLKHKETTDTWLCGEKVEQRDTISTNNESLLLNYSLSKDESQAKKQKECIRKAITVLLKQTCLSKQ